MASIDYFFCFSQHEGKTQISNSACELIVQEGEIFSKLFLCIVFPTAARPPVMVVGLPLAAFFACSH